MLERNNKNIKVFKKYIKVYKNYYIIFKHKFICEEYILYVVEE